MRRSFARAVSIGVASATAMLALWSPGNVDWAWGAPPLPVGSSSAAVAPPAAVVKGADIPANPSAEPSASEWSGARVILANRGSLPATCKLELLHEWLRITCRGAPGAGLVAGDPKVVHVSSASATDIDGLSASVLLPIRRGKAFIVSFLGTAAGYNAASTSEGPVVQVAWREGADDPLLFAY